MSSRIKHRKLDLKDGRVDLAHGSGGRAMAHLIAELFQPSLDNDWLRRGNDQAAFDVAGGRMVITTDTGTSISPSQSTAENAPVISHMAFTWYQPALWGEKRPVVWLYQENVLETTAPAPVP